MPVFGAKTIKDIVRDMEADESMTALEVAGNASIKMKPTEALRALASGLIAHKGIKTVNFTECEITDSGCEVLAEILANNHVIETVILEKNKIASAGAQKLADGLANNTGVRTLNLLQQAVKSFGDECLDHFILMYSTNITLTKMTWRLDSRKSFMLAKLQTRNIEIQKAKLAGKDFEHLLPDNLKSGAAAPAAAAEAPAPAAPQEIKAPRTIVRRHSTVAEMEAHVAAISEASPEVAEAKHEELAETPAIPEASPEDAEAKHEELAEAPAIPEASPEVTEAKHELAEAPVPAVVAPSAPVEPLGDPQAKLEEDGKQGSSLGDGTEA